MNRRGHQGRVDANHGEIKHAFELLGCTVVSLASVGDGCPDLAVGVGGHTYLIEVKAGPSAKLTPAEHKFCNTWRGQWCRVDSIKDVVAFVGLWRTA